MGSCTCQWLAIAWWLLFVIIVIYYAATFFIHVESFIHLKCYDINCDDIINYKNRVFNFVLVDVMDKFSDCSIHIYTL